MAGPVTGKHRPTPPRIGRQGALELPGVERGAYGKDDYYTPPEIFEYLELEFDVDVAAPRGGVPWIPARTFYTIDDDGLSHDWSGRVWCNPPYSRLATWARRFIEHGDGILCATIPGGSRSWYVELIDAGALSWIPTDGLRFYHAERGPMPAPIPWPMTLSALGTESTAGLRRLADELPGVLVSRDGGS